MFGKRNNEIKHTVCDTYIRNLVDELREQNQLLRAKTEKVIVAVGVINLYPEGSPDRKKAEVDAAKAKNAMMASVAHYDAIYSELRQVMASDGERISTLYWTIDRWSTSHEIIENTYKYFWKKA